MFDDRLPFVAVSECFKTELLKRSETVNNDERVRTYVENVHATKTKDQLYLFKPKEVISSILMSHSGKFYRLFQFRDKSF
jgi:hypothetical protein